jgi:hypothetical protein
VPSKVGGVEPFLRSCQLCSYSTTSQHFMEPGSSVQSVHRNPPIVPILNKISPLHTAPVCLSKIHFNIVHLPTSLSFWVSHRYTKLQTHNCLKEISKRKKNWSQDPDGRLTPGQTGRLTVGRKLIATATTTHLIAVDSWIFAAVIICCIFLV